MTCGDEQVWIAVVIEIPIQIVIPHSDTHARLCHAIIVQRDAPQDSLFAKSPIVVVHEKEARSGIASDVNVWPAIFIEIGSCNRQAVTRGRLRDTCTLAHISERPVAVASIEPMPAGGQPARPTRDGNP